MRTSASCVKPLGFKQNPSTKYTGRSVEESSGSSGVRLYDAEDVRGIRRAAATAAFILREVCRGVVPGVSTAELDHRAEMLMAREEVTAAFNRFEGFPGHICVSVNDEAAHGIGRDGRIVNEGDLVSIDVGVFYEGYVGDCAGTVCPGTRHSRQAARLLSVARESLAAGIAKSRKGNYIAEICDAIGVVVRREGLSIVQGNVGHGCGRELHEPPALMEDTPCGRTVKLSPGMVLALEPVVTTGNGKTIVASDGWTIRCADAHPAAHVEHMVLITENKPEILTWPKTVSKPKAL